MNSTEEEKKPFYLERLVWRSVAWAGLVKAQFKMTGFRGKKWWEYVRYPFVSLIVWTHSLTRNIQNLHWRSLSFVGLFSLVLAAVGVLVFYLIMLAIILAVVGGLLWLGYKTFKKSQKEQSSHKNAAANAVHMDAVPVDGSVPTRTQQNTKSLPTGTTVENSSVVYENSTSNDSTSSK